LTVVEQEKVWLWQRDYQTKLLCPFCLESFDHGKICFWRMMRLPQKPVLGWRRNEKIQH
jgi:hypothetical protein